MDEPGDNVRQTSRPADARDAAVSPVPAASPGRPAEPPGEAEKSDSIFRDDSAFDALTLPEAPASGEERARGPVNLVPPDRKPPDWWRRHCGTVFAAEWAAAGLLLAVGLYYLFLLVVSPVPPPAAPPTPPSREEFRARVRELRPIAPDPAWKASAQIGRWRRIVIHHTATESGNPGIFDRYHRENNKWPNGLGYHFVIGNGRGMGDGEVAVGKRWLEQLDGAHVKGLEKDNANSYSIGVALVGDFEKTLPTARQLAALKGLLAFLRTEYGIGLAAILGHDAVAGNRTACPGQWFFVDEVVLALANP